MWKRQPASEQVKRRIVKLLVERQVITTDTTMNVLKEAGDGEVANGLVELRNEGVLACVGTRWYIRDRKKTDGYRD